MAVSALAEWLGVRLSGDMMHPAWLLRAVKCADYILTPLAGGCLVTQLRGHILWRKLLVGILAANTVFQLAAVFTGWMVTVDAQHRYAHGPLYSVYVAVYLLVAALIIVMFIDHGRRFRRQNKISLYAILSLVLAGIALQEVLGGGIRTAYLALTMGMALMYIHTTEFSQLEADDQILEQKHQLTTDPLTGILNRYAYTIALKELNTGGQLPERLAVFSVDINGLKTVNDTLGHEAGDELICAPAFPQRSWWRRQIRRCTPERPSITGRRGMTGDGMIDVPIKP